jgi:hypothetical protein
MLIDRKHVTGAEDGRVHADILILVFVATERACHFADHPWRAGLRPYAPMKQMQGQSRGLYECAGMLSPFERAATRAVFVADVELRYTVVIVFLEQAHEIHEAYQGADRELAA